jgi:hypothetical protein
MGRFIDVGWSLPLQLPKLSGATNDHQFGCGHGCISGRKKNGYTCQGVEEVAPFPVFYTPPYRRGDNPADLSPSLNLMHAVADNRCCLGIVGVAHGENAMQSIVVNAILVIAMLPNCRTGKVTGGFYNRSERERVGCVSEPEHMTSKEWHAWH